MGRRAHPPLVRCSEFAATQHGVITASQAIAAGLSRRAISRLVVAGSWRRVRPSVFALWRPSDNEGLWLQRLSAAALWLGTAAAVSHRAAGALRGLDGIDGPPLEFTSGGRRRASEPGLIIHRMSIHDADVERYRGFRVTSVARTLVDLCAVIGPHSVELAFEHALRERLVTMGALRAALERSPPTRKGRSGLRSLLEAYPGRTTDSALEVRVWRLLRESGLPRPVRQYEIRSGGRLVARADFAYPSAMLAIEADSRRFHSSGRDWQRDLVRQNALIRLAWTVYRITWDDVTSRGHRIVDDIATLLARSRRREA
jgi:very-short-patch-repair endonuclease